MKTLSIIILLLLIIFSCQKEISPEPILSSIPSVITTAATSITNTTAASGGNITDDGGAPITVRGVCWSTSPNPVPGGSHTTDGTGSGAFASNITGLTAMTVYYARAYATNSVGTAYGNEITFTTTNTSTALPTITTASTTAITMTTATSGGNITNDGGATITARGVCWATTANPTTALSTKTIDGTGTGIFASAITGLTAATVYHVRAYATNSVGTAYGGDSVFTTASTTSIPTITTTAVTAITNTTAASGGSISTDGGAPVTARGVCWSTTANPTIALPTKTSDGTGIGTFTSAITGLTAATLYHVRAYATNSVGTAYGSDVSFTTTSSSPDVYVAGVVYGGASGNGVATVWKNGVPTALSNATIEHGEAHKVVVSGTDVYVLGRITIGSNVEGRVWKNGIPFNFGTCSSGMPYPADIVVLGTDVYVTGFCDGVSPTPIIVWKNGVITAIINGTNDIRPMAIFVSGTDIYVSGADGNDQKLWKNGIATTFSNSPVPGGWENSLFVSGTDVYVAFNEITSTYIPKIWKNGVVTNLTNFSGISPVHDVYVSGTDVYAAGSDPAPGYGPTSIATIWKNGVRSAITNGTNDADAESIFVSGTDVYVAGFEDTNLGHSVKLWKNGISVALAGANLGLAYSVFVK